MSSAIAIGTGGPFGAEGPIIMTGGAIGSLIAQMLPVNDAERKTLLVSGAAAGMTTVFGTPIAAVMLGVELLLFEWRPRSFIPVVVAAVTAAVARTVLHMPSPLFPFAGHVAISLAGLASWMLVGAVVGLLACALSQMVYGWEDLFAKLPIHWMWWPMIGGLVVGLGGLIEPRALGVGYENIAQMLSGDLALKTVLLLLIVKAIIWSTALGSGTSGGVLAPLFIIGGAAGAAMAGMLPGESPGLLALLGMAAAMSGAMRVPLTATFFAAEVTGNMQALLPLLTASATAYAVTVLLMRRSILTEKITRRGHHIVCEYDVDSFVLTCVRDVMTTKVETVPATMTLHEAVRFLAAPATAHPSFPVVDADNRVLGIIDPPTVLGWRHAGRDRKAVLRDLLAGSDAPCVYPDEYVERAAERLAVAGASHLAVVSREDDSLVGYVGWKDITQMRAKRRVEEGRKTAFFGARTPSAAE